MDIDREADLHLDLRQSVPLPDNSCSMIYNEHFLEHLDYPEPAFSFLKECYRLLEPGGVLRIGVPDTEWPLKEYCQTSGDKSYYDYAEELWDPSWCKTKLEHINHHFRENGSHKFAYDFETLKRALEEAGFQQIKRSDFDPSIDNEKRKLGTLYVRAVR
ncbi:MAG: methyltransferase domain-containing protein [Calditrichaeota bacterium]|nr:methyltransferase domain-containing protein [Calditrichota bacterium]